MTATTSLHKRLIDSGYYNNPGSARYSKTKYRNQEWTYTFLGGGWVELLIEEYPISEGWTRSRHRISELMAKESL